MRACGHVVAAAFSSASPSVRLSLALSDDNTPPVSCPVIEIEVTADPVAPGGLAFALKFSCVACATDANARLTSSVETPPERLTPPPTAAVGSKRASRLATAVDALLTAG